MASFIYFYAKFTEELLLLTAAGIFTLLSIYCYHWVVKRRLLGVSRNQVPASVVKAYLNQLINEAQFVRTQLFGLLAGSDKGGNVATFQMPASGIPQSYGSQTVQPTPVPQDLLDRLKALETQLADKESMVVNINVEKTKLLEELEALKNNQKAIPAAAAANSDDLVKKIKSLEERLEEYSLFEDDLANLKRLQQENAQLKKRLEEGGASDPASARVSKPDGEPKSNLELSLDADAVNALLDGESATPPMSAAPAATEANASQEPATPVDLNARRESASERAEPQVDLQSEPPVEAAPSMEAAPPAPATTQVQASPAAEAEASPAASPDDFEKLVDSVETSLDQKADQKADQVAAQPEAVAPETVAPAIAAAPTEATAAPTPTISDKTDEELLKEFENLLNS